MPQRIPEQLHAAIKRAGLSLPVVLLESKLEINRFTLWKKLSGKNPMNDEETEAIVSALRKLGVEVTYRPPLPASLTVGRRRPPRRSQPRTKRAA